MPPTPEETPCPECAHVGLDIKEKWVTQTDGFSLAGVQPKALARRHLTWECPECGASGPAC
jgi:predicted RNA-binding Zn-ribbon protein involved in translation (DUF1610 family)